MVFYDNWRLLTLFSFIDAFNKTLSFVKQQKDCG